MQFSMAISVQFSTATSVQFSMAANTVLMGVLILLCLVWWPEGKSPPTTHSATTPNVDPAASTPVAKPLPTQRPSYRDECAACPEMQSGVLEAMKRSSPHLSERVESVRAFPGADTDCRQLLRQASASGTPNPDVSHLGGCDGKTPLHIARTPEEIEALLDAGADINARDRYGQTALHHHAVRGDATEQRLAIVDLLLDAGIDVLIEDDHGDNAWEHARKLDMSGSLYLGATEHVAAQARKSGLSVQEYLDAHPAIKRRMDEWPQKILLAAKIRKSLLTATVNRLYPGMAQLRGATTVPPARKGRRSMP